jgi:hypothetical protein
MKLYDIYNFIFLFFEERRNFFMAKTYFDNNTRWDI